MTIDPLRVPVARQSRLHCSSGRFWLNRLQTLGGRVLLVERVQRVAA